MGWTPSSHMVGKQRRYWLIANDAEGALTDPYIAIGMTWRLRRCRSLAFHKCVGLS